MSPEQAANLLRDDYFRGELEKLKQEQIDLILTRPSKILTHEKMRIE